MSQELGRLAGLYVLADDDPRWKHGPVLQARAACAGGAAVVQLRAKFATDREALALAEEIREITRQAGILFFVNDRFDLALAAGADGVHLGQKDIPPRRVPEVARRNLLIGRSTHTAPQVAEARREPVDYIAFGPVFGTRSKASEYGARGVDLLAKIVRIAAPCPVVAIGGTDSGSVSRVSRTGAAGFAVISAVAGADDPIAATHELVDNWNATRKVTRGRAR